MCVSLEHRATFSTLFCVAILSCSGLLGLRVPIVTQVTQPGSEGSNIQALYYDDVHGVLLYSDAINLSIHRLDPITRRDNVLYLEETPIIIVPTKGYDDRFIIARDRDLLYAFWDYNGTNYFDTCLIVHVEPYCQGNQWHLGRADARGLMWAGTRGPEDQNDNNIPDLAALYRVDTLKPGKASIAVARKPVTFSNGLNWTKDNRILYFSDGGEPVIYAYDFDLVCGVISNPRIVFNFTENGIVGSASGLVVDTDGNLWLALFSGGAVINVNPNTKTLIRRVEIPVQNVSDLVFGGPRLNTLYVGTTVREDDPMNPLAGSIFAVNNLGVTGVRPHMAAMNSDCTPMSLN